MTDDWSLKNKSITLEFYKKLLDKGEGVESAILYKLAIIETLRKKLITDIQLELYAEDPMELLHNIVKIINKRFGVNE